MQLDIQGRCLFLEALVKRVSSELRDTLEQKSVTAGQWRPHGPQPGSEPSLAQPTQVAHVLFAAGRWVAKF